MLSEPPLKAAKSLQTERLTHDADLAQAADPELYPVPDASDASDASDLELNGLLLSACQADETAAASTAATTTQEPRERLSAFTFALRRSLHGLLASEGSVERISAGRLLDATAQELKRLGFKQTPLLQETSKSAGLGAHAFITLLSIGGSAATVPAQPTPAAGTPATPIWLTPDFQRLLEELARAMAPADGVKTEPRNALAGRM